MKNKLYFIKKVFLFEKFLDVEENIKITHISHINHISHIRS